MDVQFTLSVNGSLLGRWYRDVQFTLGVNGSLLGRWYRDVHLSFKAFNAFWAKGLYTCNSMYTVSNRDVEFTVFLHRVIPPVLLTLLLAESH